MATTKKKRTGPRIDPERLATIVADMELHGDKAAAQRHGVSVRTLYNYRERVRNDAELSKLCSEKKAAISEGWVESVRRVRLTALQKMETLIHLSDDLREVTGALKILNDAILAERVVSDGLGDAGAEPPRTHQEAQEAPVRTIALFRGGRAS